MKRVIVHVGPPKTGTSVLQKWFNANHSLLADHGILYPEHKVDANGVSSGNKDIFLIKNSRKEKLQFDVEKYEDLLSSFNKSDFKVLLLSSEFFFSHIPNFVKFTKNVKLCFIAYVRPEHEFVESIYNQSVKRNKQTDPIALRQVLPFSYLDRLIEYIDEFGPQLFHLRGYGAEGFFVNGIISDFCQAIDIKSDLGVLGNEKINGSYNFECMEFKRWTNKFDLKNLDGHLDSHLQAYNQGISDYTIIPEKAHARYKEQTKAKIDLITRKATVINIDALINYINTSERRGYYHQELHLRHVEYVSKFIVGRDPIFLAKLYSLITKQAESEYDVERLKLIKKVLSDPRIAKRKFSYVKYLKNRLFSIFK